MGDFLGPQQVKTGPTKATDFFSDLVKKTLQKTGLGESGSLPEGFDFGTAIQSLFSLPKYGGDFAAPMNQLQLASLGLGEGAVSGFDKGGFDSVMKSLTKIAGGDFGPGAPDLASIYKTLSDQSQIGLGRTKADLRENYSFGGLRNSTALQDIIGRAGTDNEANILAEVSRIAPQLLQTQIGSRLGAASLFGESAGIPLRIAQGGFNLGEAGRGVADQGLQRMYQDYVFRNQLFPLILQFLGGSEYNFGPSPLSQVGNVGIAAASLAGA